jgi:hypothetical protein
MHVDGLAEAMLLVKVHHLVFLEGYTNARTWTLLGSLVCQVRERPSPAHINCKAY